MASLGVLASLPWTMPTARAQIQTQPRFAAYPFSLGVASGYPSASSVMLWTRLAPVPEAPGGGMAPEIVPVRWEVASDERMSRIVASGTAYAEPDWGHSVHVLVPALQAARPYWYRFSAGEAHSATGRTRTAPAPNATNERMRFAFASCQQYEHGYFGAYRHLLADEPDVVFFLGDYIYEGSWGREHVRRHKGPEAITLNDYRARHAQYKSDADLQAAHAQLPWVFTWDDHEVENDYAGNQSENLDHPEWFLARRAAAYRAYYENQPLPPWAIPHGPHMRLHNRFAYGNLASFHVLDDRQYRSPQACSAPGRGGSSRVDAQNCAALKDARRTLLGAEQERWLEGSLGSARTRWNVLAQQTQMARWAQKRVDETRDDAKAPGSGTVHNDGWDGYPAARQRLIDFIAMRKPSNPVIIGGDVHMSFVADIKQDFDKPDSPTVASEFTGTSITSQGRSQTMAQRMLPDNPHIQFAEARYRGYTRVDLTPTRMNVDFRDV